MSHKPVHAYWKPLKNDKQIQRQFEKLLKIEESNAAKRNVGVTCDISASIASIMERSAQQYGELADDIAYFNKVKVQSNDTRSSSN